MGLHPRQPHDDQIVQQSALGMDRGDVADLDADVLKGPGNANRVAARGDAGSWQEAGTRAGESRDPWIGEVVALAMSSERESRHGLRAILPQ
jgi:hypothetical protein